MSWKIIRHFNVKVGMFKSDLFIFDELSILYPVIMMTKLKAELYLKIS